MVPMVASAERGIAEERLARLYQLTDEHLQNLKHAQVNVRRGLTWVEETQWDDVLIPYQQRPHRIANTQRPTLDRCCSLRYIFRTPERC
eukprot:6250248-Amphidinium_carterae.1